MPKSRIASRCRQRWAAQPKELGRSMAWSMRPVCQATELFKLKSREAAMAVLRAKVQGTRVLAEVLSEQHPDFLLLCSSLNSVVGGFGQVDDCAANAFLDAFAHSHKTRTGTTTISINWDMWSEVGMAVDTNVPEHLKEQRSIDLQQGITASEGQDVFARLLTCALPQVLVSTREFAEMQSSRQRVGPDIGEPAPVPAEGRAAGHPRPYLNTTYVSPQDEMERTVTAIWQQALGIDKIGVHDNFFELGGNSLLAVQVVGQIWQATNASLPVASFYADPTVASLTKLLRGQRNSRIRENDCRSSSRGPSGTRPARPKSPKFRG